MSDFREHAPDDTKRAIAALARCLCVSEEVLWQTRCGETLQRFGDARFEAGQHHEHAKTTVTSR